MTDPTPIRQGIVTDKRRTELLAHLKCLYQKRVEAINAWRDGQWLAQGEVGEVEMHELFAAVRASCDQYKKAPGVQLSLIGEPRFSDD